MVAPVIAALLPSLLAGAREVLDRVLPDPEQRARAEVELLKAQAEGTFAQRAEQALALAQVDVNKAEATTDAYRGGWRPAVGWTLAAALALQYVAAPLIQWGAAMGGHNLPPIPTLDGVLWELLFGMLGLGALRTFERVKGKA